MLRIVVAFFLTSLIASNQAFADPKQDQLKELFNFPQELIQAQFIMTKEIDPEHKLQSSGEVFVSHRDGICWITKEPIKRLWYIMNNGEIYNYYIDESDIANPLRTGKNKQNKQGFNLIMQEFLAIIHGDLDSLNHNYDYTISKLNDQKTQIELKPKDLNLQKAIKALTITVENHLIIEQKITEQSNNETIITFNNQTVLDEVVHPIKDLCHD